MPNKKYNGVIALGLKPGCADKLCIFDDCPDFKECYPEEWEKLQEEPEPNIVLGDKTYKIAHDGTVHK